MNAADLILMPNIERGRAKEIALIFEDRVVSYAALYSAVAQTGEALTRLDVHPGDRVVLVMTDSPEMIAAYLGAMRIGAIAVAVNIRLSAAEIATILADAEPRLILADPALVTKVAEAATQSGIAARNVIEAPVLAAMAAEMPGNSTARPADPQDMAFWIYTSGTTGRPKAAIHCHGDVAASDRYLRENLAVGPGDRLFATSKLFFAYALGTCLFGALRLGATTVLHADWPEPSQIAALVERHRPTILFSVPSFYRAMLRAGVASTPGFAEMRACVSAGERLPEALYDAWHAATGVAVLDGIGTSEVIYMILANRLDRQRRGSSGTPCGGVSVKISADNGTTVNEPGATGVLWVSMPGQSIGYWQQPDATSAAFRDGWFRTGDLFSIDSDGFWHHHGRADDMLRVSGQWVSPGEIEEIVQSLPEVSDAAVIGTPDADGLQRLVLFIAADAGEAVADRITEALKSRLAIYKCPRDMRFVEAIPRTATGKIQRYRLREIAAG